MHPRLELRPGPLSAALAGQRIAAARATAGLWRRDSATWSAAPLAQNAIAARLGWLASPALMTHALDRITRCADDVRSSGVTDVVLLGMGGSSLAATVLHAVIGVLPGWPRFHVLDSTDPAAIAGIATAPVTTLYVIASKSGGTIESNALAAYFRKGLEDAGIADWGSHFIAITDAGTSLEARARADRFRDIFINPSDIGGRYSAISFFGLVPAALMGQDVHAIVDAAREMLAAADPARGEIEHNPAALLGLAIGTGAMAGRDKLTLVMPRRLEPLGLWVEQLVAESTGKCGKGIVPVTGEVRTTAYGDDRIFVRTGTASDPAPPVSATDGAPAASIELDRLEDLGGEFARWEVATAVAGALLGINPFDEPNVQSAKDATQALLADYRRTGVLQILPPDTTLADDAALTLTSAARILLGRSATTAFLNVLKPGDYLGLLAYLGPDDALARVLQEFRTAVLGRTSAATTFGYGPRYLHSTGQLHKGGQNSGVFVVVTATPVADLQIPLEPFSFGTLELAQALGDFSSLDAAGRRAVHIHLPAPDAQALKRVFDTLLRGLP